jgi:alpha-galactosidase
MEVGLEVPFRHGIKQVIGENGGPGGLFHTMRMAPPVLNICHDVVRKLVIYP